MKLQTFFSEEIQSNSNFKEYSIDSISLFSKKRSQLKCKLKANKQKEKYEELREFNWGTHLDELQFDIIYKKNSSSLKKMEICNLV